MKTMNNKSSFVRHTYQNSRRMHSVKKVSSPSDEESDSEEDERERRKYLSLQGGESFFWSANRLNKMFTASKAECYDEINCNYFNDRTSSMSSFKRNVQARHSLKLYRRRPLANINNLELYEKVDNSTKPSQHTFTRAVPVTLDDIQMNSNMEYGFNPRRVNSCKSNTQVRLRPLSICTPPREKRDKGLYQTGSYFTLAKLSPKIISYATNDYEIELEKQLLHLRSQSCNLNFQGCEGNLTEKELKEDLAMARRQRFVRRKLSFEYHPKKKWKKAVSLDSGLATEGINPALLKPQLDASRSEELLNDSKDVKSSKMEERKKKTKSVEFLEVRVETSGDEKNIENELIASTEAVEIPIMNNSLNENDMEEETFTRASVVLKKHSFEDVSIAPADEATCANNLADESSVLVDVVSLCTLVASTPIESQESPSEKQETPTKSSEKGKRLKTSIPQIFSNFRLPNKSTFRKLIRRKTLDNSTPLKASHDIIRTELFSDKCNNVNLIDNDIIHSQNSSFSPKDASISKPETPIENDHPDVLENHSLENETVKKTNGDQKIMEDNHTCKTPSKIQEKKIPVMTETPCAFDVMESVSMDSLNSFAKSIDKHPPKMIDKSISAYSLPRVDEDKEFSSSLERRSRSSCSISVSKVQQRGHEGSRVRRMSETDFSWEERPIRCSPGKRFMRRILSPVVCGFPPPEKYGMLNDSMHSLNSYDSGSVASDSEHNPQLFDFSSQELVEEMTLIDKELLVHIPWEELAVLGWMSPDKFLLAPNIMKMVQFFNRIAMLVTTNVLMEESVYRRAKIIKKAIKLAYKCRCLKNYNSLKAVLGGLQCTPVFRLKATWKEVPSRYRRIFRDLSELMTEENNFANYRKELHIALLDPPCIPFLGNFLTEVAHTHAFQAVHSKYHAPVVLTPKDDENWKNEVFKKANVNNVPHVDIQSENTNHDSLERLMFKKNHSRTNSEHSNPGLLHDPPRLQGKNHSRTDSDDSGVVLSIKRYSTYSEDLESPRESCLSSPDEDSRNTDDVIVPNGPLKTCFDEQPPPNNSLEIGNGKDTHSINIPNRLKECECMFWKYQIHCVAYNFIKRPYVCRYLVNSPFNTEEDSYKLSLKREPPKS